ncbi:MAG TPA: hypothetical protein VMP08_03185 [Anaerolineae bacterium]|nr:hypothetical protein [Anaerolineae bacterium]
MSICPPPNLAAKWIPPDQFDGYPQAIRAYLTQGGDTANLLTILRNASSINDKWGGVLSIDLSGDGEPETIVSIFDPFSADQSTGPSGMLLIYGCENRQVTEWYENVAARPNPLPRIVQTGNFIAAPRGNQIAIQTETCGADTCFEKFDVLGWDGQSIVSLLAEPLELPAGQFQLVQADADVPIEIQAQKGLNSSIGAGPQRTEKQLWDWNGAQYVKVKTEVSPVEYRIHAVYEADDAFTAGDYPKAIDWYSRVLTDDSLKDWLTEIGVVNAHDKDTLKAYARFRLLLIGLLRNDANAVDQLKALTTNYPDGSPVNQTTQMAQLLWDKYQATKNWAQTCAAVDAFANDQYQITDDLSLFGYSNRLYISDDMCPIK